MGHASTCLGITTALLVLMLPVGVAVATARPEVTLVPELAGHWEKVPRAPWGAGYPAVAVFDADMLVMDRETGRLLLYDPETGTWERRRHVPGRIESIGPWVATDRELVVFDLTDRARIAAYDPATDTWRWLPGSPLPEYPLGYATWVSTNGRIVAASVRHEEGRDLERHLAVLDLADGTWAEMPPPVAGRQLVELTWTGASLLATTTDEDRGLVQVESFDPQTGAWSEPEVVPVGATFADPVWAGDRLVFAGDELAIGKADASYDPVTLTASDEDYDCPISSRAAVWTGELLVGTNIGYALDPATGDCFRLPGRDRTRGASAATAWTGDRLIYWSGGGAEEGQPNPYRRGGNAFVFDQTEAAG